MWGLYLVRMWFNNREICVPASVNASRAIPVRRGPQKRLLPTTVGRGERLKALRAEGLQDDLLRWVGLVCVV